MKKLLDRIGRRGTVVMAISAVVIAMALQPFLGTDAWAGLGQWAGGLGAFFAAWAALTIAKQEARRENERDAETRRIHAYYVRGRHGGVSGPQGTRLLVTNEGKEPVLRIQVVAIHLNDAYDSRIQVTSAKGVLDALLPGAEWDLWVRPEAKGINRIESANNADIEIRFKDLGGTWWRRIGNAPPTKDDERR